MTRGRGMVVCGWVLAAALGGVAGTSGDDTAAPLELADLPAYRAALAESPSEAAEAVSIRSLYDLPVGGRYVVEGRIVRRFQQPGIGQFPSLVEGWISSPGGNIVCVTYPDSELAKSVKLGATVRFAGRYLKRIRYESTDQARFAPLLVGGGPPGVVVATARTGEAPRWETRDWLVGLAAAGLVLLMFLSRMIRRPRRRRLDWGPAPTFLEEDRPPYNGLDGPDHPVPGPLSR